MSAALVVRVFGMLADGTTKENMHFVVAELVFFVLMLAGILIERGRRQQVRQAA
jgi:hypothetical protein